MYVCMYVCMKPNLVPRVIGIIWTFACVLEVCLNLALFKFWSRMDNFKDLFKKNNNFGKLFF